MLTHGNSATADDNVKLLQGSSKHLVQLFRLITDNAQVCSSHALVSQSCQQHWPIAVHHMRMGRRHMSKKRVLRTVMAVLAINPSPIAHLTVVQAGPVMCDDFVACR